MFFSLAAVEVGTHLYWNIAGLTVHGQVLLVTWLVIAIILGIAIVGAKDLEPVPKGLQNFVESVFEYVSGIAKDQIGGWELAAGGCLLAKVAGQEGDNLLAKHTVAPASPMHACRWQWWVIL